MVHGASRDASSGRVETSISRFTRGPHRQLYRYCGHVVDEVLSRTPLVTLRTQGAVGVLMSNQPTPDFVYTTDDDAKSAHMSFRRQRCILVDRAGGPAPGVPATLTVPLDDAVPSDAAIPPPPFVVCWLTPSCCCPSAGSS